jgi:hypothetical protein
MFKNNSNRDGEKQEASVVQGFEIGREGWEIEDWNVRHGDHYTMGSKWRMTTTLQRKAYKTQQPL